MPDATARTGKACLMVFLTPFFLVGVVAAVVAVVSLATGEFGAAGFAAIFAVAFIGLPSLVIVGARSAQTQLGERKRLMEEHPDEPWRWNPEWFTGRLVSSAKTGLVVLWLFTLVWNAISIPGSVALLPEIIRDREWVGLLFLIFPLIGTLMLVWAIHLTAQHRKYGASVFEMAHVPGVIGRGMGGLLRTSVSLDPSDGFVFQLSCVNRVTTGSGDNRSTRESVQWQETEIVTEWMRDPEGDGVMVPVAFSIPSDAPQTDDSNRRDEMVWRLKVSADVPGIDYDATFTVPVFRTALSQPEPRDELAAAPEEPAKPFEQPPESRIQVTEGRRGVVVRYPAARSKGTAAALTVFGLTFTGGGVGMYLGSVPLLFPILFGAVGLLLCWVAVNLWLRVTEVRVGPGEIEVATGLVFPMKTTQLDREDIDRIELTRGMQSGNTLYTDIKIMLQGGKRLAAGSNVRRKREAEWIVSLMRQHFGDN